MISDLHGFSDRPGMLEVDGETKSRAVDLGVPKEELCDAPVPGLSVCGPNIEGRSCRLRDLEIILHRDSA